MLGAENPKLMPRLDLSMETGEGITLPCRLRTLDTRRGRYNGLTTKTTLRKEELELCRTQSNRPNGTEEQTPKRTGGRTHLEVPHDAPNGGAQPPGRAQPAQVGCSEMLGRNSLKRSP